MDLNVSPPEEDDDYFEQRDEEDRSHKHVRRVELGESAVQIARRERDERRFRLKRERVDDRPTHAPQLASYDNAYPRNLKTYDKSKLPPGWLDCPAIGQEIHGIIPSKVPLGENFSDCIPPGQRYSFKQVFTKVRVLGKKIGLVIDLTNTSRYYNVSDLKKDNIKHVKIQCRGRDSVPDNESVNRFVYEVSQFLSRQKKSQEMKHIFVHCTHGHNRTGFMIVHYLVRMRSFSVTQAIKEFADARPPGIYKPDYIAALYTFYHENRPEMVVCPQTPEWKRSSDLDLNGDAVPDDEDEDGETIAPEQENHEISTVMTNDDVLGDAIPYDQQDGMRHFCYIALKLTPKGNSQFPGSHPVSLDSDNLQLLRQRYYYATWKADGTRYMMLITLDGCYLIDRNFNFRRVQMRFPALSEKTHHYTLLDGEMIIDTVPDTQKQERRYLIYDLMAINGQSIVELPFSERWKLLDKEILQPRRCHLMHQNKYPREDCYRYDLEPFRVRRKDFWPLSTVHKLLREFIPKLSHEADGLIFQGWDDPYVPRTHEGLLKWKYAHMNSVDFLFEMVDDRLLLSCFERGRKKLMRGDNVQFSDDIDPTSCAGKIIECAWDKDANVWVYMRIRPDKTTPNDFNTYKKVLRSIRDNITEEVLMSEINEIIELPMYVERKKFLTNRSSAQRRG